MEYQVRCDECGADIAVSQSQAGGVFLCECGTEVIIPRLSDLRLAAGQTRYSSTAVDRVRGMLKRGELPTKRSCPVCGNVGDTVVHLGIQCEKASATDSQDQGILAVAVFGWLAGLAAALRPFNTRASEIHGRETRLEVPLQFCKSCLPQVTRSTSKRKLRQYLGGEPAYRDVFVEYPRASVDVVDSSHSH
jgi:hypothetical protein